MGSYEVRLPCVAVGVGVGGWVGVRACVHAWGHARACMRAGVCVRACMRVCVCVRACACACNAQHFSISHLALAIIHYHPTYHPVRTAAIPASFTPLPDNRTHVCVCTCAHMVHQDHFTWRHGTDLEGMDPLNHFESLGLRAFQLVPPAQTEREVHITSDGGGPY